MAIKSLATIIPPPTRLPRALNLVLDPEPQELEATIDWTSWYLTDEEDMGESCEQLLIIRALVSYLTELAYERKWHNIFIGADQFFAWIKQEPLVRVSPDVYLLDEPLPRPLPASWQIWLPNHKPPRWAVEIVSAGNWRKDYRDIAAKYAQLGVLELVVFDHDIAANLVSASKERVALQVFRRTADDNFVKVYRGTGPIYSEQLNAWLVITPVDESMRLRIARDANGVDLVPSVEDARRRAERRSEQERMDREHAEQLQQESARQLTAALAEIARLRNS